MDEGYVSHTEGAPVGIFSYPFGTTFVVGFQFYVGLFLQKHESFRMSPYLLRSAE